MFVLYQTRCQYSQTKKSEMPKSKIISFCKKMHEVQEVHIIFHAHHSFYNNVWHFWVKKCDIVLQFKHLWILKNWRLHFRNLTFLFMSPKSHIITWYFLFMLTWQKKPIPFTSVNEYHQQINMPFTFQLYSSTQPA